MLCDSVFSSIHCYSVAVTAVVSMHHVSLHVTAKPKKKNRNYLKIDMSSREPAGTSFIEEVNVFNQETEERDDNLEGKRGTQHYITDQKPRRRKSNHVKQHHWNPSKRSRHCIRLH